MIEMTYDLAMAAGKDAADRLKRKKGLTTWDQECMNRAIQTFHDCYGHDEVIARKGKCPECQLI